MPAKTLLVVLAAEAERELEQLLGFGHVFGGDHAGDAQIDLGEVVDRAFGGERLGGERRRRESFHGSDAGGLAR